MIFVLFKQLQKGGKTKLMKSDEEEELQIPKKKELKVCIKNNRQPLERLRMKDKHIQKNLIQKRFNGRERPCKNNTAKPPGDNTQETRDDFAAMQQR